MNIRNHEIEDFTEAGLNYQPEPIDPDAELLKLACLALIFAAIGFLLLVYKLHAL